MTTTKKVSRNVFDTLNVTYNGDLVHRLTKLYSWNVKEYKTLVKITLPIEDLSIFYKMF